MLKATLRNLAAHKFRLALTVLSVVLGVALVAGTLVFTDTLRKTFDDLFAQTSADVQVSPKQVFTAANAPMSVDTVPAQVLDTVRSVQGVEKAEGGIFVDGVQVVGPNGKLI